MVVGADNSEGWSLQLQRQGGNDQAMRLKCANLCEFEQSLPFPSPLWRPLAPALLHQTCAPTHPPLPCYLQPLPSFVRRPSTHKAHRTCQLHPLS